MRDRESEKKKGNSRCFSPDQNLVSKDQETGVKLKDLRNRTLRLLLRRTGPEEGARSGSSTSVDEDLGEVGADEALELGILTMSGPEESDANEDDRDLRKKDGREVPPPPPVARAVAVVAGADDDALPDEIAPNSPQSSRGETGDMGTRVAMPSDD